MSFCIFNQPARTYRSVRAGSGAEQTEHRIPLHRQCFNVVCKLEYSILKFYELMGYWILGVVALLSAISLAFFSCGTSSAHGVYELIIDGERTSLFLNNDSSFRFEQKTAKYTITSRGSYKVYLDTVYFSYEDLNPEGDSGNYRGIGGFKSVSQVFMNDFSSIYPSRMLFRGQRICFLVSYDNFQTSRVLEKMCFRKLK